MKNDFSYRLAMRLTCLGMALERDNWSLVYY